MNNTNNSTAVKAKRHNDYKHNLDFFPTPPQATHALFNILLNHSPNLNLHKYNCLEPAVGQGHMANILNNYFKYVHYSDIKDYGYNNTHILDYSIPNQFPNRKYHWIITNPPFKLAEHFIHNALIQATHGIAILARLQFLESKKRYNNIFTSNPPQFVFPFTERLHMIHGRLPNSNDTPSATAYAWFVWIRNSNNKHTTLDWITPTQFKRN